MHIKDEQMLFAHMINYLCDKQKIYFTGRRNIDLFQIISHKRYLNVTLFTVPLRVLKVDMMFLIIGERLINSFIYFPSFDPVHKGSLNYSEFEYSFFLPRKVKVNSYHITISKLRKVTISYS